MANRISSFRGGGNVVETTVVTVFDQMRQSQDCVIGDPVKAGHGNLGVSGAVRNQKDILEGQSDQGGSRIGEQVNIGERKNKAIGLEDVTAKSSSQVEDNTDLNSLHVPVISVGEHLPHVA